MFNKPMGIVDNLRVIYSSLFGSCDQFSNNHSGGKKMVNEMTASRCFSEGWNLIKDEYLPMVGISLCGLVLMYLLPVLLQGPVYCGMFVILFDRMRGRQFSFERFFDGFNFFLPSLLVTIITLIPGLILTIVVVILVFVMAASGAALEGDNLYGAIMGSIGLLAIVLIVGVVAVISFQILLSFALPLVVEERLGPVDACRKSARAVGDNLGFVVGLVVIQSLLLLGGALLCGIGVLFAFPIVFASSAVAYRHIFGFDSTRNHPLI